jgi:mannan endo-1,4-beta-mannosidase
MSIAPAPSRVLRSLAVAALATLPLLLALILCSPAEARSATAKPIGLASARSLGGPISCDRLFRERASGKLTVRRRSVARRLRGCRRQQQPKAAASSAGGPLYWGAWIGSQLTGNEAPWDMGAVSKFEAMAGKSVSLVNFSSPFANCSSSHCSFYDFPAAEMESIREHGAIPFFSWASQSTPSSLDEPEFQLSDVIAGTYDSYIREFAEAAKAWGHPFFLRFNWEMNGNWFPWSEGVNGNQPGEYVAAWRHVHDIFTEVGATNASWVWCPNVDPFGKLQNLSSLYPGDEYVDWTGLDGYNWGTNPASPKGWMSFDELFSKTYDQITETIAPSKPLVISEVGSSEYGGSKSAWIENALLSARTNYPDLRGICWFEKYDDGMDWPIESSASATSAFASGIQDSSYLGNQFGSLTGTIKPVS